MTTQNKDEITLANEHGSWQTLPTLKWNNRKPYTPTCNKEIKAAIPGKIVKVFECATIGMFITKGTPLLELEAMKMVNTIVAPQDGKIIEIAVKEGTEVGKNALLINFE